MPDKMRNESKLFVFLVAGAVFWTIFNVSTNMRFYRLSAAEFRKIQGCYLVNGLPIFRIEKDRLVHGGTSINAYGFHEKDGDVIELAKPILLDQSAGRYALIEAGTASRVPIVYSQPLKLSLHDARYVEVFAYRADSDSLCGGLR